MNRRYRKTVIAGNWKMNMTATETKKFAEELKKIMPRAKWCDTLICVPACNISDRRQGVQGPADLRGRRERVL